MKSGDISYSDRLKNRQPGSEMTGKYFDLLKTGFTVAVYRSKSTTFPNWLWCLWW